MSERPIKISIIDDHPVILEGVAAMLKNRNDIELISQHNDANTFLKNVEKEFPDILLLDIKMPQLSGDNLADLLLKKYPGFKIIVFTYWDSLYYIKLMLKRGVKGYLLKTCNQDQLVKAIHTVNRGLPYIEESLKENLVQQLTDKQRTNPIPALTKREKQILQLMASNYTSMQIADKLFVSKRTIDNHRANMLLKFKVKNAPSLIKKAVELNLI